jgi:hypothetical protein
MLKLYPGVLPQIPCPKCCPQTKYKCEICNDTKKIGSGQFFTSPTGIKESQQNCPDCCPTPEQPKTLKKIKVYAPMIKNEHGNYEIYYSQSYDSFDRGHKRSKQEWIDWQKFEVWDEKEIEVAE